MRETCGQCQTKNRRRGRPYKMGAEKLTHRITVRLSFSELEALKRLAEAEGMTPSEYIRYLIGRADLEAFKRSVERLSRICVEG